MYYRDRDIWIGTNHEAESLTMNSLFQLHCAYYRNTPNSFQTIKEKIPRGLQLFLSELGIHVYVSAANIATAGPHAYTFVDDKDQFLFNLKFGNYRY